VDSPKDAAVGGRRLIFIFHGSVCVWKSSTFDRM